MLYAGLGLLFALHWALRSKSTLPPLDPRIAQVVETTDIVPKFFMTKEEYSTVAVYPDKQPGFDYRKQQIGFMYINRFGLLCVVCLVEDTLPGQYKTQPRGKIALRYYRPTLCRKGSIKSTPLKIHTV
jgi:hypothetical protein